MEIVWEVRRQVMYPELSVAEMKLTDDDAGLHLGLYHSSVLCSVISLFQKEDALQFRKFATISEMQGRGLGSLLLQHVFAYAKALQIKKIWCNARTTAAGFYERFGMQPFGATWQQHGHLFIKMQIEL